ncbi:MAG: SNF2-related protein, partial [Bacteroidota bacterium]
MNTTEELVANDIVYNLVEVETGLYLPTAYIVSRDDDGLLAHVRQKATAETVGAFQLELNTERQRSFTLVSELQIEAIEAALKPPKFRKPIPMAQLNALTNKEGRAALLKYVHQRLNELLNICLKADYPVSLELERRVLVKEYELNTHKSLLEPMLSFKKTAEGVKYRLKLKDSSGEEVKIRDQKVIALTNHPAPGWLIIERQLVRLAHLNGFVIKPFVTKDEVVIPAQAANNYFRRFIARVVSKVEIEAEGFAVEQHQELISCRLELVQHPLEERYYLYPKMDYGQAEFGWNEQKQERTLLDTEGEEVSIIRLLRDKAAESEYLAHLTAMGLKAVDGTQYFHPSDMPLKSETYAGLSWLLNHWSPLLEAGFDLAGAQVGEHNIYPHAAELSLGLSEDNDWFDLKGEVSVGEYKIPFAKLIKYIRNRDRLYPLPNGTYFLIPEEWLTQYGELSEFVTVEKDTAKLARSHYTLLENFDLDGADPEAAREIAEAYKPGSELKASLRPYQLEGVKWLIQHHHQGLGACLADDMGLGKTLQTIAVLLYAKSSQQNEKKNRPAQVSLNDQEKEETNGQLGLFAQSDEDFLQPLRALIVLPASLIYNWAAEIEKFAPSLNLVHHTGPSRQKDVRVLSRFDIILTTYQTANRDQELLRQVDFSYIVLDESQQIKNRQSKAFKALNSLNAAHRVSLSGTPIENSLSDLWSQMQFINPGLL